MSPSCPSRVQLILCIVVAFAAEQVLMQKLSAVSSGLGLCTVISHLICLVRRGHVGRILVIAIGVVHRALELEHRGNGIGRNGREKLGIRQQVKQLVEIELLHLSLVGVRVLVLGMTSRLTGVWLGRLRRHVLLLEMRCSANMRVSISTVLSHDSKGYQQGISQGLAQGTRE